MSCQFLPSSAKYCKVLSILAKLRQLAHGPCLCKSFQGPQVSPRLVKPCQAPSCPCRILPIHVLSSLVVSFQVLRSCAKSPHSLSCQASWRFSPILGMASQEYGHVVIPRLIKSCQALSCLVMSCHVLERLARSCQVLTCLVNSCQVLSCLAKSSQASSLHVMPIIPKSLVLSFQVLPSLVAS